MVDDYAVIAPIGSGNVTFFLQGDNRALFVNGYYRNYGVSSIQAARESKSSSLTSITMPFADSDSNLSWDYLGVKRDFTIDAIVTGSQDDITRFIWLMNQVLNGSQHSKTITLFYKYGRIYDPTTNAFTFKSYNIIFKDFIINYEKSSEGRLNYTVTFEEGKRDM